MLCTAVLRTLAQISPPHIHLKHAPSAALDVLLCSTPSHCCDCPRLASPSCTHTFSLVGGERRPFHGPAPLSSEHAPSLVAVWTSAPLSSRCCMASTCPFCAAHVSAVHPEAAHPYTPAPPPNIASVPPPPPHTCTSSMPIMHAPTSLMRTHHTPILTLASLHAHTLLATVPTHPPAVSTCPNNTQHMRAPRVCSM